MRVSLAIVIFAVFSACAPRGQFDHVPQTVPGASIQRVHVATERNPDAQGAAQFGEKRSTKMRFGWADVSIPPNHERGRIEWPGHAMPDPARHFVLTGHGRNAGIEDFIARVARQVGPGGDISLFVHGYNTNNAEAVYLMAQAMEDFKFEGAGVLFSWPSAGRIDGYVYDRDSVIFARDALEQLLTRLTALPGRKVQLAAHSMGTQLVMETLRQMSIGGNTAPLRRLDGVILISPDIDEDVFIRQMARVDPVPRNFTVTVTQQDRVLGASALLTGRKRRLGALKDLSALEHLPVRVVDLSHTAPKRGLAHSVVFQSAAAMDFLLGLGRQILEPRPPVR